MKTAIVTGGNRGLGFLVSKKLAAAGWRVVVAARSKSNGDEAIARIRAAVPNAAVETRELDVSSFASIRAFAANWTEPVQALVNNAGMMIGPGESMHKTPDGLESTMATNYFGSALLGALLLPKLRAGTPARIVNVSSRSILGFPGMNGPAHWDWDNLNAEKNFEGVEAYKRSKLAMTWFTFELAQRLQDRAVTVNAVCPGFVPETVAEHAKGFQKFLFAHVLTHVPGAFSAEEASSNIAWAVTEPAVGDVTGQFFGERKPVELKSPATRDAAIGQRLWDLTWKTTGVDASALSTLGLK